LAREVMKMLRYLEAAFLSATAAALVTLSLLPLHVNWSGLTWYSGPWQPFHSVNRLVCLSYGIAVGILACAAWYLQRHRGATVLSKFTRLVCSLAKELCAVASWIRGMVADATAWLAVVIAVGLAVRCYFLSQPMRYDEAYTFLNFVNKGVSDLFYYPLPNNHVLHTLLVRASVELFGSHPVAIRLPALLAGISVIVASFCLSRIILGGQSGYLSAAMVAVFPFLILYDTMARGYSIVVLLSLCLAILSFRFSRTPSLPLCVAMSLVTSLGLFAVPSFLFPAAGLLLWTVVVLLLGHRTFKWIARHYLVPYTVVVAFFTSFLYTPVIIASNGINSIVNNRFVRSLEFSDFLARLPDHISNTLSAFSRDVPLVVIGICGLLILSGLYQMYRRRQWDVLSLVPALVLGAAVTLFVQHAIPFRRTWIYVLPFLFVYVDAGISPVLGSYIRVLVKVVLLLLTISSGVLLMNHNVIAKYDDTGYFPEAPIVVDVLSKQIQPGDVVIARAPADEPVRFYLWYKAVPAKVKAEVENTEFEGMARQFFVVRKNRYGGLTNQDARKILEIGDAELFVVP